MPAFIQVQSEIAVGRRGAIAETGSRVRSCLMAEDTIAGLMLVKGDTLESTCEGKLPESAAELLKPLGPGIYQSFRSVDADGNELLEGRMECYVDEGAVWCVVEEAVDWHDKVYVRHTANGTGKNQLGAFRNDSDGGSVVTLTVNTATSSSRYEVEIDGIVFAVTSDSDATTAEVATALASAIDDHASYAATPSTNTVEVTKASGEITVGSLDSRITSVSGATCALLPGARFDSKSTGPGIVKVWVNFPA